MTRIIRVYLLLFAIATPLASEAYALDKTDLTALKFETVNDTRKNRSQYPFLVDEFEQIQTDEKEISSLLPAKMDMAVYKRSNKGSKSVFFVKIIGPLSCGTAGCSLIQYKFDPKQERYSRVTLPNAHPSTPLYLLNCNKRRMLVYEGGHGTNLKWAQWDITDEPELVRTAMKLTQMPGCKVN